MRTQGILLVRDAIFLLNVPPIDGKCYVSISVSSGQILILPAPGTKQGSWRRSCDQAVASLEEFSQNLLKNISRFRDHGDKPRADAIGSSCIPCLAHLAALYELVCQKGPGAGEMYDLCDLALQRLGMLTSELHFDEYTYLDLLLGVRLPSCFPTVIVMAQTGLWDRTLGRSHYQSSTSG